MNSRGQFVIEGIRQAGKVFSFSLPILFLFGGLIWFAGFDIMNPDSISGALQILCVLIGVVFGSILAGPVPFFLTYFDVSDTQLLILSCVISIPYWLLVGTLAGLGRWNVYMDHKGQPPAIIDRRISKQIRLLVWSITIVIAVGMFFPGPFSPRFGPSNRLSEFAFKNQLSLIADAKREFALANHPAPDYVPTETDLSPYLHFNGGRLRHFGPERYVINSITNPPYAILTNTWWIPRHGWQEGHLVGTNGTIFRLPETPSGK